MRLAASRKEPPQSMQRARNIALMLDDPELTASDSGLKAGFASTANDSVWVRRFNEEDLEGQQDRPRVVKPSTHSQAVRRALISLVLLEPNTHGNPFKH